VSNFTALLCQEHVTVNAMMRMSALYHTIALCWIFIVLTHLDNSPQVDV